MSNNDENGKMDETQTDQSQRRPQKGQFYAMSFSSDDFLHGVVFANEEQLLTRPRVIIKPAEGGFPVLRETPHMRFDPKQGKMPRDFQDGFSGYWLVSERLKQIFESVDPDGFESARCDFTLPDGSEGPQFYLCDVVRTVDALDEEASTLRIKVDPSSGRKNYSFAGGAQVTFKKEMLGDAHAFRTPHSSKPFCDRLLFDAIKAAGKSPEGPIRGLSIRDAADY